MATESQLPTVEPTIPEQFSKIISDFTNDLTVTFPEYAPIINKLASKTEQVFKHCSKIYPERFFDILYQNADIFKEESEVNTEFIPGIVFKHLWTCDITDNTRNAIWKHLQLVLFSIIGTLENKEAFGNTAALFDNIDQEDFKSKLEETLGKIQEAFGDTDKSNSTSTELPTAENVQEHMESLLGGKLGKLAQEIAEETASDLNIDMENTSNMQDVFSKLLKNPTKLMGLVKNVGDKLDTKLKSGEIKESELLAEAGEMMNRMKNMPGMDNIQSMLSKMGMPSNAKLDLNAMESKLNQNMKTAKMKERMKKKLDEKKASANVMDTIAELQKNIAKSQAENPLTDEQLVAMFSDNAAAATSGSKNKKKKNKK